MAPFLKPENIKNILIIGHTNIGDISCDLVIIHPLKERFPQARIYFITSPVSKNLIEGYKGIEGVIVLDRKNKNKTWGSRIRFNKGLGKYHFDLVIVLPRTLMHNFLFTRYVWNIRKDCKRDFLSKKIHPIDIYLKYLRSRGVDAPEAVFDYQFDGEKGFCEEFFQKNKIGGYDRIAGIFPLAAWGPKNWSVAKWNELAEILHNDHGVKTIAFGKSTGESYTRIVKEQLSPKIISAIDKTSLKEAAALIQRCRVFIGPDSSFLHIASCLGVETIGLYGPTPVDYVYPYFHRAGIILSQERGPGMLCQVDQHHCPCLKSDQPTACMEKIRVEDVLQAVRAKLF